MSSANYSLSACYLKTFLQPWCKDTVLIVAKNLKEQSLCLLSTELGEKIAQNKEGQGKLEKVINLKVMEFEELKRVRTLQNTKWNCHSLGYTCKRLHFKTLHKPLHS